MTNPTDIWTLTVCADRRHHSTTVHFSDTDAIRSLRENFDEEGDLDNVSLNIVERFEEHFNLEIELLNHPLDRPEGKN